MEENKKEVQQNPAQKVDIFIERAASASDEQNLFVGVNGVNYILPRGKTSTVPGFVAREIERSRKAREHFDDTVRELKAQAQGL